MKFFVTLILVAGLWLKWAVVAEANTVVFSDDFSQGFEKWQPVRDDGHFWQVIDGRAVATIPLGSTISELVPKDHYWDNDWQNLEYGLDFTPITGVDRNISFGFQDPCNWYETHFVEQFVRLVRLQNCSVPFGVTKAFNLENNRTYHITIRFLNGAVTLTVDGQVVIETTDWSFNQNYGKVGLKAGTGASYPTIVAYDNIRVSLIESDLGVTLLKQTDPQWANAEYDSAHQWAEQPTISRWGCALVSLVMVMKYHGLAFLPDGQPLTPLTLNAWLLTQPDGYLGQGILNWVAATRLTRLISDVYHTVKLEYKAIPGETFITAISEIHESRPVILQIDGHFMVADGVAATHDDLLIKDPDYIYDHFSGHQQPLLSTRTFLPTHTDLSYFVLAHPDDLYVTITDKRGQPQPAWQTLTETITSDTDSPGGVEQTSLIEKIMAQPPAGTYFITISQETLLPFSFEFFVYDQQGNLTELSQTGWVGRQPQTFKLDFRPETNTATLTSQSTWRQFYQDIQLVRKSGGFGCWILYWLLDWSTAWAIRNPPATTAHYQKLITLILDTYRGWMTDSSFNYLQQQLTKLHP